MTLGALDYVFGAIIIIASLRCVYRGFVAEIIAVAAVGGGILTGLLFSAPGADIIARGMGESPWNRVIAFLLIFLGVYLLLKIFEGLLYRLLDSLQLENLDRALGFFLGVAEGILVSVILMYLLQVQPFADASLLLEESIFVRTVLFLLPAAGGEALNTTRILEDSV